MAGYTKLFSSILDSTIWREPDHVRLVWITMLAMSDKNSVVEASIPGLADRAKVSIEQCEDALERLRSPDKYSRTQEYGGRRIEDVDGGWFLLNHGKYRDLVTLQERRAQDAERARRYRERKKLEEQQEQEKRDGRDESREITPPSPSPSPSPSPKKEPPISPKGENYSKEFLMFWGDYPKKVGKGAAWKAWKRAIYKAPAHHIHVQMEEQKDSAAWKKNNGQYIPNPATWLNQGRWDDEPQNPEPSGHSEQRLPPAAAMQQRNREILDRLERKERE